MRNFEVITRAVIISRGKILLCHSKNKRQYFFPGGHVEFGEDVRSALKRELKEELGARTRNSEYIGSSENVYFEKGKKHHEINLVFLVGLLSGKIHSQEDHIDFSWVKIEDFYNIAVLPRSLHKSIIIWLKDKKPFWASHKNNQKYK